MHIFDIHQIPYSFPTLDGSRDLTGKAGPSYGKFDELISQIPTLPPMVPGREVVEHYIDRCIIELLSLYNIIIYT